ncbi:hypothetical protein MMC17_002917 [Xylographa soralifera]|nr:hypothetical protein [Xylographa soralifera]
MSVSVSRISPAGFEAGVLAFLIVALLTSTARTAIRWQIKHKFYADDAFLGLAVASFSASWGMVWYSQSAMWQQQEALAGLGSGGPAVAGIVQTLNAPIIALSGLSVFAVKFSFLFLFRRLIRKSGHLKNWWWTVVISCAVCTVVLMAVFSSLCGAWSPTWQTTCPDLLEHARIELIMGSTLDVLTDFMVISIPVILLWRIKINLRQKLYIVAMLSLSGIIILIVVIRVAVTALTTGIVDQPWIIFWQIAEPSVAIIMVSINAFRHPFVSRIDSRSSGRKRQPHSSNSGARPQGDYDPKGDYIDLPALPPSTVGRSDAPLRHKPVIVEEIEMILPLHGSQMEASPRRSLSF